jgi:hypothetical protein
MGPSTGIEPAAAVVSERCPYHSGLDGAPLRLILGPHEPPATHYGQVGGVAARALLTRVRWRTVQRRSSGRQVRHVLTNKNSSAGARLGPRATGGVGGRQDGHRPPTRRGRLPRRFAVDRRRPGVHLPGVLNRRSTRRCARTRRCSTRSRRSTQARWRSGFHTVRRSGSGRLDDQQPVVYRTVTAAPSSVGAITTLVEPWR